MAYGAVGGAVAGGFAHNFMPQVNFSGIGASLSNAAGSIGRFLGNNANTIASTAVDTGFELGLKQGRGYGAMFVEASFQQSKTKITMPAFSTLWKNYPHNIKASDGTEQTQHPSRDSYAFNQCAIRLGKALINSGVSLKSYPELLTSEGYPRWSTGLAKWLSEVYAQPVRLNQSDFNKKYSGKTGIFYEEPLPGEVPHIDLWNKGKPGSGYHPASKNGSLK